MTTIRPETALRPIAAIDGGGTKTAGRLALPEGRIVDLAPAGGCNPQDGPGWRAALDAVLAQVPAEAAVVLGLPGFGEVPAHDAAARGHLAARPGPGEVVNDVVLALDGAFGGGPGVLVLAGTGSMAMAAGPGGTHRAGGWGDLMGDEGSAHWIGQAALARAAAEIDGRAPDTGFARALAARLGAPEHRFGLLDWLHAGDAGRARLASVAVHVDALAGRHPAAAAILDAAAGELTVLARAAARRAGLGGVVAWAGAGSVTRSATVAAGLARRLGPPRRPLTDALGGGLLRAAALAGWPEAARAALISGRTEP